MFCAQPPCTMCSFAISVTAKCVKTGKRGCNPIFQLCQEKKKKKSNLYCMFVRSRYCSCEWHSENTQAEVHSSPVQHDTVSHLTAISVKRWHTLSRGSWVEPIDEMKQVDFSLGLKWNEKQMSWRVTESVCVLSARPTWVMALIWPPAPRLFIILRWQGGAGKRRGLGAPSWSITLEVSFPLIWPLHG